MKHESRSPLRTRLGGSGNPMPIRLAQRRGLTLVELLIAMVAAGIVVAAAYQLLLTNQRLYTVQRENVVGHQTIRAGSEILFSELREVSPGEGDLLGMQERQVTFRALRAFGLVCHVNASQSRLSMVVLSDQFDVGQGIAVFVENEPEIASDDFWAEASVQNASSGASNCTQSGTLQTITTSGLAGGAYDGIRPGAPIRSLDSYVYGAFQVAGEWYLGRRVGGGTVTPLVGPLDGEEGLRFQYLDAAGSPTTTAANVRRIRITLETRSGALDGQGQAINDVLTTDVFLRN
ncbi:MAG: prepilin-type N-terminal cleavage/methylation domain-containing protein [Gemmatimonadales bacterium]|nr:MAG: prepilin-type N-terminal cleavage/methylation domain-containing protein [Gemmatimonadales bacterium]